MVGHQVGHKVRWLDVCNRKDSPISSSEIKRWKRYVPTITFFPEKGPSCPRAVLFPRSAIPNLLVQANGLSLDSWDLSSKLRTNSWTRWLGKGLACNAIGFKLRPRPPQKQHLQGLIYPHRTLFFGLANGLNQNYGAMRSKSLLWICELKVA